jgi:pimeloyl-ACP methyl ester carboxylesterase
MPTSRLRRRSSWLTLLLLLPAWGLSAADLAWQPYTYTAQDRARTKISGESATLIVPENPAQPAGAKVELAVYRLRATGPQPGAPIVYLHGGPGGASVEHLESPEFRAVFAALQREGDVVMFDQRGCGKSRPSFLPVGAPRVQTDTLASREAFLGYIADISETMRRRLVAEGHNPAHFTVPQSVADIEALRVALGVPQLRLFGHSFGTQLAQAYVRAYPERVERVVLAGPRGMDTARKLPAQQDEFLGRIAELARADATVAGKFPDLLATLDRVLARLDREPVAVELEGADQKKFTLRVGGYALRFIIAKFYVNDPDNFRYLPKLLDELDTGRRPWSLIFNLGQIMRGGISFVWFTTDAASGVSAARAQAIAAQIPQSRLRDAMNFPFPDINRVWQVADLGDEFRAPLQTSVPALFVAGSLDGITPVEQAREVMHGFSAAQLLVVENAGHTSMFRGHGVPEAMAAFFRGDSAPVSARIDPVPFMPLVTAARN